MPTDTKLGASGASSGSSAASPRKKNLAKLPTKSATALDSDAGMDDGQKAALKLKTADYLLTQLQSIITDLKQQGVKVKFYRMAEGTQVALMDVWVCPKHQILYSGPTCPIC